MCGIVGYCLASASRPAPDLEEMIRSLVHRGPDEDGRYIGRRVALGMRRLSIIDLASGSQPVANETRDVRVVLNGEIYNYRELRRGLERAGHAFTTQSDTEVLVHGYEEWGDDLPLRLRGMFAFAIHDERSPKDRRGAGEASAGRVLLARDPMGIKPLYYAEDNGTLYFGSEMKALLGIRGVSKRLDPRALDQYLTFLYVPEPRTIFEGIRALLPGCRLTWAEGAVEVQKYWAFEPGRNRYASPREARADIEAAFSDSVQASLVADVPVGLFLSGGMDSASILSVMSRHLKEPVRTFSIGFGEKERQWDELAGARAVADHFRTDHHEFRVVPDIVELLPQVVKHFDQPFANPTAAILYLLSREARRHVKVALSGTGGDEMFAGYPRYLGMRLYGGYGRLPSPLRRAIAATVGSVSRDSPGGGPTRQRLRRFAESASRPFADSYISMLSAISEERKSSLYTPEFRVALGAPDAADFIRPYLGPETGVPELERLMGADLNTYLPFNQLAYADRMSMAQSLEVRVPFVDRDLAERAGSIPLAWKTPFGRTKGLFRAAMRPHLPQAVIRGPKRGLNLPIALWFRESLEPWLRATLSAERLGSAGIFRPEGVEALIQEHRRGARDHSLLLWALVVFQAWRELYLEPADVPGEPQRLVGSAAAGG